MLLLSLRPRAQVVLVLAEEIEDLVQYSAADLAWCGNARVKLNTSAANKPRLPLVIFAFRWAVDLLSQRCKTVRQVFPISIRQRFDLREHAITHSGKKES
jgi:hypothetical protein